MTIREVVEGYYDDAAYEKQGHKCAICGGKFEFAGMQAGHIKPWSLGGHTAPDKCQMLCIDCNLKKGAKYSGA